MSAQPSAVAQQFVAAMNEKFPAVHSYDRKYSVVVGRKYEKIVLADENDHAVSAHAFYDPESGLLYKAEGWAKPAKGARYDLASNVEAVVAKADRFGGYLYR